MVGQMHGGGSDEREGSFASASVDRLFYDKAEHSLGSVENGALKSFYLSVGMGRHNDRHGPLLEISCLQTFKSRPSR
jgi:hypothetical protein